MRRYRSSGCLFGMAVMSAIGLAGQSVAAQGPARPHVGIGYVANAPDVMVGGVAYVVWPALGGIGLYVDAKFPGGNPSGSEDFEEGLTPGQVESQVPGVDFRRKESSWRSFSVALIRPLNSSLMVYGGLSRFNRTEYWLYEADPTVDLGRAGVFWVESPDDAESGVSVMAGALMRLSSLISTQFGFESRPKGITVGVSLRLPPW
jgi:hypothetical protein